MNKQEGRTGVFAVPREADMRRAIVERDASRDGQFYYGVVTTGVFCRPSCASRPPRPENLRFFLSAAAARSAGFRACKRCRPDEAGKDVDRLVELARHIEAHADESLPLATLAHRAGLSPGRLQKKFKAAFGVSPKAYQDGIRLGKFRQSLRNGSDVTDAIYAAGYGSTSRVYGEAMRNVGMAPRAYRAGGEGETIHYACGDTALGTLLMAATGRGVCFAQFGESANELVETLSREFPNAQLTESQSRDAPELDAWMQALDAHLADDGPRPDLPLDLRGTAFQLRVWRFLLSVREGEVLSYGELAGRLGQPRAARAVAAACAANRIGVLVPCHRVLRGNGDLGGYRWGIERKRTLLDRERRRQADAG